MKSWQVILDALDDEVACELEKILNETLNGFLRAYYWGERG